MRIRVCGCLFAAVAVLTAHADFEVYFMRHGETPWNKAKVLQGSIAYTDLTPVGVAMAEDSARGLKAKGVTFDRVYTSPYCRAKHTASILAHAFGLKPQDDARLRERFGGKAEGRHYDSLAELKTLMEGAETEDEVTARALDFLEHELKPLDGKVTHVLCVSHTLLLNIVERHLSPEGFTRKGLLPNCCVHVLKYHDGRFSIVERAKCFYDEVKCRAVPLPRAKFGILSDIHLNLGYLPPYKADPHSVDCFRKALQCMDGRAVDGVLISGDLTQIGQVTELRKVAEVWNEVFPNGRGHDGRSVARLFVYGDHEVETFYNDIYLKWFKQLGITEKLRPGDIEFYGKERAWREAFGEPFVPIRRVNVRGYDFVLAHLVNRDEDGLRPDGPLYIPGLEEFFRTNSFDAVKPFFYVQHKLPKGTVGGPTQSGQDSGRTSAILSRYPNAVGFCGHKHRTVTEELSLWQGAFTQIQVPALATLLTAAGRENSKCSCEAPVSYPPQQMPELPTWKDGAQALVMSIYDDRLVFERIDVLHNGEQVVEPWVVKWPQDGSAAYGKRGETAGVPQFAAGAKVTARARRGKDRTGAEVDQVEVRFPAAASRFDREQGTWLPRAYDYEVTAILRKGVVRRIVSQKRVYSAKCYLPEQYDTNDVVCVFGTCDLDDNHDTIAFEVRPSNAWGAQGAPIVSTPAPFYRKGPLNPY